MKTISGIIHEQTLPTNELETDKGFHDDDSTSPSFHNISPAVGDATLDVLDQEAYRERFDTEENPNLDCLQKLHRAGVEIYVCGQSLVGKKARPEQVVEFVDVAVSALTAVVNLQADGYSYVPLLK